MAMTNTRDWQPVNYYWSGLWHGVLPPDEGLPATETTRGQKDWVVVFTPTDKPKRPSVFKKHRKSRRRY